MKAPALDEIEWEKEAHWERARFGNLKSGPYIMIGRALRPQTFHDPERRYEAGQYCVFWYTVGQDYASADLAETYRPLDALMAQCVLDELFSRLPTK